MREGAFDHVDSRARKLEMIAHRPHTGTEAVYDPRFTGALDLDAIRPAGLNHGVRTCESKAYPAIDSADLAVHVDQAEMQPGRRMYDDAIHEIVSVYEQTSSIQHALPSGFFTAG
jgi:hypothetical protein